MPTTIEIWRSVTGISPDSFTLLTTLADTGTPFSSPDGAVQSQQVYIYKARRRDAASGQYSAWSPLVYARAPWPLSSHAPGDPMPNTNTGMQSILAIGRETVEGVPVVQQKGLSRKSGAYDLEMSNPDRDELRNIDTDFEEVPGYTRVTGGPFALPITPEGISRHLCALFGDPVTTAGGGAAPAAPAPTTATVGGTIPGSTVMSVKTAYVGPSPIVGGPANWAFTASPAGTVTSGAGTATNTLGVASPAAQAGMTAYNVYAGTAGSEVLQNAAPIALGTAATITALLVGTAAAPAAYNVHTFKSQQRQVPHTVVEKRGQSLYAFPGGYVDTWDMDIDKTASTAVEASVGYKFLNQLVYAALSDLGLDVVGFDPLPSFGSSQVYASLGGALTDSIKTLAIKIAKNMKERDALNGKLGPVSHFPGDKAAYTGTLGMYFADESAMNISWGVLDSVSKPYGARKARRTTQLVVALIGEVNAAGFRNALTFEFPKIAFKRVGKPVQGQGEIMQSVEWKAYYSQPDATGCIIRVFNSESLATITTAGTNVTAVAISDVQ